MTRFETMIEKFLTSLLYNMYKKDKTKTCDFNLLKRNKVGKIATVIYFLAYEKAINLTSLDNMRFGYPYEAISIDPEDDSLWYHDDTHAKTNLICRRKENGVLKPFIEGAVKSSDNGACQKTKIYGIPEYLKIKEKYYNSFYPVFFDIPTFVGKDKEIHIKNHRDLTEAREYYDIPNIKHYKDE